MLKPWSDSPPPTPSMTKLPPPIRSAQAPVALPRRRSRRLAAPSFAPANPLLQQAFPSWARPPTRAAVGAGRALRRGFLRRRRPRPVGSNSSRSIRRSPGRCASASPCAPPPPAPPWRAIARILPRCATPSISRPTPAGTRPPAPPGASIGCGALFRARPIAARRADAARRRRFLGPPGRHELRGVRRRLAGHRGRRRTSARGGRGRERRGDETACGRGTRADFARRKHAEIFALWLSDLALARRLGWDAPVPLLATAIAHRVACVAAQTASVRVRPIRIGSTPRPALTRWPPKRLTLLPVSWRALAKNFSRPSPNCAPRAPVGSSNCCSRTMPCRRRKPRRPRAYPIAPRDGCSIGSSSLAPCANSPAGRIFGSMACEA